VVRGGGRALVRAPAEPIIMGPGEAASVRKKEFSFMGNDVLFPGRRCPGPLLG